MNVDACLPINVSLMALNSLYCADVPLSNYSLIGSSLIEYQQLGQYNFGQASHCRVCRFRLQLLRQRFEPIVCTFLQSDEIVCGWQ